MIAFDVYDDPGRADWDHIISLQQEIIQSRLMALFAAMGLEVVLLDVEGEDAP
jgi:hypothetical protein